MSEWYETRRIRSKPEKMARPKRDRRILNYVPDCETRSGEDRRGISKSRGAQTKQAQDQGMQDKIGLRYHADFDVDVIMYKGRKKTVLKAHAVDVSTSGILVSIKEMPTQMDVYDRFELDFDLPAGTMSEGFESHVRTKSKLIRSLIRDGRHGGELRLAFEFHKNLYEYYQQKRWGYSVSVASTFLFFAILVVVLMRVESVLYFKYNWFLYLYSLIAALFLLSRYLFGAMYRNVPINPDYTPGVSVVIPCFNEEEWIGRTILSCVNQDYPIDKLEVIVVDDCSNDTSWQRILEMQERLLGEADRFRIAERLRVVKLPQNSGKRIALATGVDMAVHELVVFVDSDSFLEGKAIRNLVQPFQDPKMGGVTGRTDVENKYTNALTKLQTVRYYIAFRIMKAAESFFDCVTCLSGPLSCYRKDLVLKYKDAWLNQKFLGHPATFGDDRSLTNFIMQNHRTAYQDNAICSTVVPSVGKQFLNQQMRWKRSWLRESLRVAGFIWKKEPFMALFFFVGFIVPIAAPVVFIYNLVYIPIARGVFPSTFLIGLFVMALLLSFSHLIFQKSRIWLYGLLFCLFYELVLLWQMPVAWFTFAVSKWGTRDTPEDVKAKARKKQLKLDKQKPGKTPVVADSIARTSRTGSVMSTASNPAATHTVRHATRVQQFGKKR